MPEILNDGERFHKGNMNASRQQRVIRGTGSSRGKSLVASTVKHYTDSQIEAMDKNAILDGMDMAPVGGAPTGFRDYVMRKSAEKEGGVRVRGGCVDLESGEVESLSAEIRRNQRALEGSSGFAAFAARQDAMREAEHDNDRMDS